MLLLFLYISTLGHILHVFSTSSKIFVTRCIMCIIFLLPSCLCSWKNRVFSFSLKNKKTKSKIVVFVRLSLTLPKRCKTVWLMLDSVCVLAVVRKVACHLISRDSLNFKQKYNKNLIFVFIQYWGKKHSFSHFCPESAWWKT